MTNINHIANSTQQQRILLEEEDGARSLLDQLLTDSRLYTTGKDYKELLDFVARLPNFAPFNAMLLQIQKPGLRFAASAYDWNRIFCRTIIANARPLLILWPFCPVALVYDQMDTEGVELPEDVAAFYATGVIDEAKLGSFKSRMTSKNIECVRFDGGDNSAGAITVTHWSNGEKDKNSYRIDLNKNHSVAVQFSTLAHELGHLFLGHLGADKNLTLPDRNAINHGKREIEAESVSYLVCKRNGVTPKSEAYLAEFVTGNTTINDIDLYPVMRAAGQVETILGLTSPTKYGNTKK